MKIFFSVLLILSGLMPVFLGAMCLTAYPKALEMLKLADSHDVWQAVTLFGTCMVSLGIVQCLAGYWTWIGNWSGIVLGRLSGVLILFDGMVLFFMMNRHDLGAPDMVKGALLIVIGLLCRKTKVA
jgi:hypothetical protein